jgi:hypothetical protein
VFDKTGIMTTMPFEIRIALFGGAGNGKTTLINALVRDNYGSAVLTKRKVTDVIQYRVNVVGKIERESYVIPDLTLASEETVKLSDGQEMMEVLFDIQVEQAFVETRDDTRFVFVCVPDGEPRFHTYAAEKWDTFDAAFIIIDGKKGYVAHWKGVFLFCRMIFLTARCVLLVSRRRMKHSSKVSKKTSTNGQSRC